MTQQGVCPSVATLIQYKLQLFSAQKGLNLLKTKIEALKIRFRLNLDKLITTRTLMFDIMKDASLKLFQTCFYNEKQLLYNTILNDIGKKAQIRISFITEHVAGVNSIQFKIIDINNNNSLASPTSSAQAIIKSNRQFPLIGLCKGGKQILLLQKDYQELIKMLVQLASLQFLFATFSKAIKSTKCRVNGIEYVIIPKTINIINYILIELEERDREEFYRVKQICRKRAKQDMIKLAEKNRQKELLLKVIIVSPNVPAEVQPKAPIVCLVKLKKLNLFGN